VRSTFGPGNECAHATPALVSTSAPRSHYGAVSLVRQRIIDFSGTSILVTLQQRTLLPFSYRPRFVWGCSQSGACATRHGLDTPGSRSPPNHATWSSHVHASRSSAGVASGHVKPSPRSRESSHARRQGRRWSGAQVGRWALAHAFCLTGTVMRRVYTFQLEKGSREREVRGEGRRWSRRREKTEHTSEAGLAQRTGCREEMR
jgi:hypothetical protein